MNVNPGVSLPQLVLYIQFTSMYSPRQLWLRQYIYKYHSLIKYVDASHSSSVYLCFFCDYCYYMFVSRLVTYNSFLFVFSLSVTHLIQVALYAFEADTINVPGSCLGLYVLELSQLLKGISISCIGRVW